EEKMARRDGVALREALAERRVIQVGVQVGTLERGARRRDRARRRTERIDVEREIDDPRERDAVFRADQLGRGFGLVEPDVLHENRRPRSARRSRWPHACISAHSVTELLVSTGLPSSASSAGTASMARKSVQLTNTASASGLSV